MSYPVDKKYISRYILLSERMVENMMTAKIFENGRSQAVRLPKECRFKADEIMVQKIGDIVMLVPKESKWESFIQAIDMFSDDFMQGGRVDQGIPEDREEL